MPQKLLKGGNFSRKYGMSKEFYHLDSWYLTCYNFGRSYCSSLKKINFTSGTFPVMRRRNYIIYREYMLTYVCCSNSVEGRMNEYRNNGLTVTKNVLRVLPKICTTPNFRYGICLSLGSNNERINDVDSRKLCCWS